MSWNEHLARAKSWARSVVRDVDALRLAAADRRVPWYAKALGIAVVAYALSPIDLIPDFVPVLGYLDDVVLIPLGVLLVVRLVPPEVMAEHRAAARSEAGSDRSGGIAAAAIVCVWIATAVAAGALVVWVW